MGGRGFGGEWHLRRTKHFGKTPTPVSNYERTKKCVLITRIHTYCAGPRIFTVGPRRGVRSALKGRPHPLPHSHETAKCLAIAKPTSQRLSPQVFPAEAYEALWKDAHTRFQSGGPVWHRAQLPVLQNDLQGVQGGWSVDVMFVWNCLCSNFNEQLPEDTLTLMQQQKQAADKVWTVWGSSWGQGSGGGGCAADELSLRGCMRRRRCGRCGRVGRPAGGAKRVGEAVLLMRLC